MTIPVNRMAERCNGGIFLKHTDNWDDSQTMDFPHRDDYYMFVVLLKGSAEAIVDIRNISISKSEGLVLAPGQVHFPKLKNGIPTAWSLFVSPEHVSPSAQERIERYAVSTSPIIFTEENFEIITQLFDILNRNKDDVEFSRIIVAAIINRFCISMQDSCSQAEDRYLTITLGFKHLLQKLYVEEKRPAEYASRLNVSRVYLNEAVKAVTGMSVGAFIRNYIILNAKRLLVHSDLDVNEVARGLGYDDSSYFSRLFRKETGMTPLEFRRNLV